MRNPHCGCCFCIGCGYVQRLDSNLLGLFQVPIQVRASTGLFISRKMSAINLAYLQQFKLLLAGAVVGETRGKSHIDQTGCTPALFSLSLSFCRRDQEKQAYLVQLQEVEEPQQQQEGREEEEEEGRG